MPIKGSEGLGPGIASNGNGYLALLLACDLNNDMIMMMSLLMIMMIVAVLKVIVVVVVFMVDCC